MPSNICCLLGGETLAPTTTFAVVSLAQQQQQRAHIRKQHLSLASGSHFPPLGRLTNPGHVPLLFYSLYCTVVAYPCSFKIDSRRQQQQTQTDAISRRQRPLAPDSSPVHPSVRPSIFHLQLSRFLIESQFSSDFLFFLSLFSVCRAFCHSVQQCCNTL